MASPATYENIKFVPLVVHFSWRGQDSGPTQADAWAKNVYVEQDGEDAYSVKRPGLAAGGGFTAAGLSSNVVQGAGLGSTWGAQLVPIVIASDTYVNALTGLVGSGGGNVAGGLAVPIASLNQPSGYWYSFQQVAPPAHPTAVTTPPLTIFSSASGVYVVTSVYTGSPNSYGATITGYAVNGQAELLVPGVVTLDNTTYVMDALGRLWGSAVGDPTTWPALNSLQTDLTIGKPVTLTRMGSYVVAIGTTGLQLFYNAGVYPGLPLLPVANGIFREGMAMSAPFTASEMDDVLYWLGTSAEGALAVYALSGGQVRPMSDPAVNRFLQAYFSGAKDLVNYYSSGVLSSTTSPMKDTAGAYLLDTFGNRILGIDSISGGPSLATDVQLRGYTFKAGGHAFYALSRLSPGAGAAGTAGNTIVLDISTNRWVVWTQQTALAYGEGALRAAAALGVPGGVVYMPDISSGALTYLSESAYQDAGLPINLLVQTDLEGWGNQRTKMIPATYLQADTLSSSINLSWTDDDYTTFSTPQAISTASQKKQLIRCGSTVSRAWQIKHTDNTPMRLYGLELEVVPGAL